MQRANPVLSTYRLQFHRDFPFSSALGLAGYLRSLGVSHVYSSPILTARAGSLHGYDVISYDEINPELGGADGFREMAQALRREGLGIILDIVPNHVAVGGDDNAMWLDLLKHGPSSRYATWFDLELDEHDPVLAGRIHAPFLGEPTQEAVDQGKLVLVEDVARGGFALRYGEHLFPLREEEDAELRAAGPDAYREPAKLRALLERQHYYLDYWRNASDRLNWRRFFEITHLAGIRMEELDAFEAAHRLAFSLYKDGLIDGLRIDHVDGLADPAGYCATLRCRLNALAKERPDRTGAGPAWLLVEKILAPGETLPRGWGVDGTTGYDFMDQVSALLHEGEAEPALAALWSEISGRSTSFADEEQAARRDVLEHAFDGQLEYVVGVLMALAAAAGCESDIPRGAMRRAAAALACHMRSYRTYLTGRAGDEDPGPFFVEAVEMARSQPQAEHLALDFIVAAMTGADAALPTELRMAAVRRFNQLTSPLAARSVEDTAFYRYGRLLSRNDVGFDAARLALPVAKFHALMRERASAQPRTMLAIATHDHKRGADARARLAVISEDPDAWRDRVQEWFQQNETVRPPELNRGDEYQLYQMLVGTWPLDGSAMDAGFADRLSAWWLKALREAKLKTGWAAPNGDYEQATEHFLRAVFDRSRSAAFLDSVESYVDRNAPAGALNGIVQIILQGTVPGIPDTYQGTEFWDFSMVDPDNRRPVDFAVREQALAASTKEFELRRHWRDGRLKQDILRRLLQVRRDHPQLFVGAGYRPLPVHGARQDRIVAFARETEDAALLVIVPTRCAAGVSDELTLPAEWWGDTRITLPPVGEGWTAVIGAGLGGHSFAAGEVSEGLPCHVAIGWL